MIPASTPIKHAAILVEAGTADPDAPVWRCLCGWARRGDDAEAMLATSDHVHGVEAQAIPETTP